LAEHGTVLPGVAPKDEIGLLFGNADSVAFRTLAVYAMAIANIGVVLSGMPLFVVYLWASPRSFELLHASSGYAGSAVKHGALHHEQL
jgi:hypothetical protein